MVEVKLTPEQKQVVDFLVPDLQPKTYASGKEGFFAQGKLTIAGKRFQAQIMLVEIKAK